MSRVAVLGTLIVAWLVVAAPQATACVGGRTLMPVCSVPDPESNEAVVVVMSYSNLKRRTNLLMGKAGVSPGLLDIELKPTPTPLFVVLSHSGPAVFRFSGALSSLTRVVALGSVRMGPDHVGIVGVPRDRITFVAVSGRHRRGRRTCGPRFACVPSQFFGISEGFTDADIHRHKDRSYWAWLRPQWRTTAYRVVVSRRATRIEIPGAAPESAPRRRTLAEIRRRRDHSKTLSELETYRKANPMPVAVLDPARVISPSQVRATPLPPSWEGMAVLEQQGKIHGPASATFGAVFETWEARASRFYRSRLKPGFQLRRSVDFVVSAQITVPSGLRAASGRRIVLLVAADVPTPKVELVDPLSVCFLFADARQHRWTCSIENLERSVSSR